ncbi:CCA tRNA nucleotidyltransferase [Bdellovibrio sp. SKB1291214]|uniref:CCA tRNA nucleotidyltransferase n=1 Tax=Bdellovibrio sp. SKB1291214 TaxID=1732569 RepID=UPI000B514EEA|nr:CCA tRNA nucleotidyltransferase [Bdellovibrio sp. SKB1291214]UYL07955.1 CCA tRNA nucleotidyltransferase [Bdellovibrio sp. SKB1291214]
MDQVRTILQSHPHWPAVEAIYHRLAGEGYKAFLAGGCVRDALLGFKANDLDIATDATPETIENLFEKTINVGKVFGVMRVLVGGADIEVATFRNDGNYQDGRRPDHVVFSTPEEDAERRDFTVNALFYDLENHRILDFVNGQVDLKKQILRTVGDPRKRFQEDHLRLLRGARFAAQLDFAVEPNTLAAMTEMASAVKTVSGERLRDEMGKLLKSKNVSLGLRVMQDTGLQSELFPWRAPDVSWTAYPGCEIWQNLSLFLRTAQKFDLEKSIELLRLSTKEKRGIEDAWELWQNPEEFFTQRLGLQIQLLQKPGKQWALEVLMKEGRLEEQILSLFIQRRDLGEELPKPILNGEDLKGKLQGPAIGQCLQEAYFLQLEGTLKERKQALSWLEGYLK